MASSIDCVYARASDNVAKTATITVETGTGDAEYPAANLANDQPALPAKLTSTSGAWLFDWGAAQRQDLVALIHFNLIAGLSVRWQCNATNSWGAPTVDVAFTIPTYHEDGYNVNPWIDLTAATGYSTGGFRYGRLVIGTNTSPVAVGEVVVSATKRTLAPNFLLECVEREERKIIEHTTDVGVSSIFDLGVTIRSFEADLGGPDAQRVDFDSWARTTHGRARPFLFIPYGTVNDAWLVRFTDSQKEITRRLVTWSMMKLKVTEVGRGLFL